MKRKLFIVVCFFVFSVTGFITTADSQASLIQDGSKVKFEYVLKVDGEILESSEGNEPLEYEHGMAKIIPGLEKELAGLKVGDEKIVTVNPEEGYGKIVPEAVKELPRDTFPKEIELQKGLVLQLQAPDGTSVPAIIDEIKGDLVVLNFNHPLAGKILVFEVKIVDVN